MYFRECSEVDRDYEVNGFRDCLTEEINAAMWKMCPTIIIVLTTAINMEHSYVYK